MCRAAPSVIVPVLCPDKGAEVVPIEEAEDDSCRGASDRSRRQAGGTSPLRPMVPSTHLINAPGKPFQALTTSPVSSTSAAPFCQVFIRFACLVGGDLRRV